MSTGPVELQGITIVAPVKATLQGVDYRRNILKGVTIAVGTGASIMQLKVVDRNHEPIEGATCRVLNAITSNNVLSKDGVDDYATSALAASSLGLTPSIELIIKPDTSVSNAGIMQFATGLNAGFWFVLNRNSATNVQVFLNGGYRINIPVNIDETAHIAITYDGSVWRSYKNGVAGGTYTGALGTQGTSTLFFGRISTRFFKGKYAELRFWNTTRTPEQIDEFKYKRLAGDEAGLVGYYPLNQTEGATATELVSGNHATLFGSTWAEADESFPLFDNSIQGYDPTPYDSQTTNANGLCTLQYQINTIHGLEVTLPGKRRFIMPFERTTRGLLDWQVMLSDYLATFATDKGNILINSEPENNDANFLIE